MSYTSGSSGYSGDFNTNAHGSARFLSKQEAEAERLFTYLPELGSILIARSINGNLVYLNRQGHICLVAPARSGKNSTIIANLVGYQAGSTVTLDPRAENTAVVSEFLESTGKKVIRLDPAHKLKDYGLNLAVSCFDPLRGPLCGADEAQVLDDIQRLGDAAMVDKGGEKEQHWRDGGRQIVIACMTYQAFFLPPQDRGMIKLSRLINGIDIPLEKLCQALTHNNHPDPHVRDVIARNGAFFEHVNPKERASFISMALRSVSWINNPSWQEHFSGSDFDPMDLNTGKLAVILICPFEKAEFQPWVRLVVTNLIIGILRGPRRTSIPTLFLLDEFATMVGRLSLLEQSISFIEGAGARYLMVFQSLDQMSTLWPDNRFHGIIANSGAQIFANVSDQNTAEYVSKFMGNYSAMVPGPGGMSFVSRPLMTPDEIRTLPPDDALLFIRGNRPAHLEKINVLKHQPFKGMMDKGILKPNPIYAVRAPKPISLPATERPLLSIDDALGEASAVRRINLQAITAALEDKYPGKDLRLEGDMLGYDEPWMNPHTGVSETIFMPVLHISLLETLTKGGSSDYA